MADLRGGASAPSTAEHEPQPPQTIHRRPRVREVSSRFMSPLIQSNSIPTPTTTSSDFSKSVHRRQSSNVDESSIPDSNRNFDKSSTLSPLPISRKQLQQRVKQKENENPKDHHCSDTRVLSRPDTPISNCTDRIVSSRYRQVPHSIRRSNSMEMNSNGGNSGYSAAARLFQEVTSNVENSDSSNSCPNTPLCVPDARSSMPDVDKWLSDRNCNNIGKKTSDCARSLNFSSLQKIGGSIPLPPNRSGLDVKKYKKVSNCHEDVHSLKMLNNHYLQWRFANAKAEASIHAQKQEAERRIYTTGVKISDMRDNVKRKRCELAVLRMIKNLVMIEKTQMPYLDEWAILEEDYSTSLLGLTNALLHSSARLPVSGEVRADARELGEALSSALKVVDMIGSNIQTLMTKAEEMDASVSELAKVAGGERTLIEECGDVLSKTCVFQAKECSLRTALMQIDGNRNQNQIRKIA